MAKIYMVRHGKAASSIDGHLDPGLDELGREQAQTTAAELTGLGPLAIYSSPLARARQTAEPLAERWSSEIAIEPRVAEIPFPTTDLAVRSEWLGKAMAGTWADLSTDLLQWRQDLVDCVRALSEDSVVFCHFIAINVAVGAAQGDDRMVHFAPDNGSVTILSNDAGSLEVLQLGRSARTHVN
jgi:broad specificity phosphatase PhoE